MDATSRQRKYREDLATKKCKLITVPIQESDIRKAIEISNMGKQREAILFIIRRGLSKQRDLLENSNTTINAQLVSDNEKLNTINAQLVSDNEKLNTINAQLVSDNEKLTAINAIIQREQNAVDQQIAEFEAAGKHWKKNQQILAKVELLKKLKPDHPPIAEPPA